MTFHFCYAIQKKVPVQTSTAFQIESPMKMNKHFITTLSIEKSFFIHIQICRLLYQHHQHHQKSDRISYFGKIWKLTFTAFPYTPPEIEWTERKKSHQHTQTKRQKKVVKIKFSSDLNNKCDKIYWNIQDKIDILLGFNNFCFPFLHCK